MAMECRLRNVIYSGHGRIIGTPWRFPRIMSRLFPRALADNVLLLRIAEPAHALVNVGVHDDAAHICTQVSMGRNSH